MKTVHKTLHIHIRATSYGEPSITALIYDDPDIYDDPEDSYWEKNYGLRVGSTPLEITYDPAEVVAGTVRMLRGLMQDATADFQKKLAEHEAQIQSLLALEAK